MQGQTCSKVILDINKRPRYFKPKMNYNICIVCFSRVRRNDDIRLLPGPSQGIFDHLTCLKPNEDLIKWLRGFDPVTGFWSRDRCDS